MVVVVVLAATGRAVQTTTRLVVAMLAATAATEATPATSSATTTRTSTVATVRTRRTRASSSRSSKAMAVSQAPPKTGRTALRPALSNRSSSSLTLVAGNRSVFVQPN